MGSFGELVAVGESAITVCCEFRRMFIVDADGGDSMNLLTNVGSGTDFLRMPIRVDADLTHKYHYISERVFIDLFAN